MMVALVLFFAGLNQIDGSGLDGLLLGQLLFELLLANCPLLGSKPIPVRDVVLIIGLIKWSQSDVPATLLSGNAKDRCGSGKRIGFTGHRLEAREQHRFLSDNGRKGLARFDWCAKHQRAVQESKSVRI